MNSEAPNAGMAVSSGRGEVVEIIGKVEPKFVSDLSAVLTIFSISSVQCYNCATLL